MKSSKQWDWVVSESVIWILIFMGLGGLVVLVPALAGELSDQFSEYRGDFLILVFLLGVPVVIGLGILGLILLLLRRIRLDRMLTEVSYKPIRWLVRLAATLAGSFALIGVWLSIKNTLPPVIAIVLAVFALISLAVALVTHVLFGLLKQAVAHSDELREVI